MSLFERVQSFVEGTDADAEAIEAEFDAIAAAFNGLFEVGRISASSDLSLTSSYQDVPGATLSITPSVPSLLLVFAVADLEGSTPTEIAVGKTIAVLNVDGSDRSEQLINGFLSTSAIVRETVSQAFSVSLTAAAHTVKLRAKMEKLTSGKAHQTNTGFLYLLIPEP